MWFVGVDKLKYGCDVFPWYHEPYEYNADLEMPRNKLSFEKTVTVHTLKDLDELERLKEAPSSNIRNIQIQPTDATFLRDRRIIDRIGIVAKELGATILLEGGTLSHAYYQLTRTGAKVEVRYYFEKRQAVEFNKLVRDKIPEKIEKNGEEAIMAELDKKLFSSLLKRKLVEEALEVLDSENDENIVAELADILEVFDGILIQHQIDLKTVLDQKEKKRNKVGGFERGVYLKKTIGRVSTGEGKVLVDSAPINAEPRISNFFQWLRGRGLNGVKLIVGDKCLGMLEAVGEVFPDAKYQRCVVHFYRNVFSVVPKSKAKIVAKMLKAIHAQENKKASREKAKAVVAELRAMKLKEAAKKVEDGIEETLTYCDFPSEHWTRIRTNNVIERLNREIRHRTRVVGTFPDGNSALMLVYARLRHVAGTQWGNKKYMNMKHLEAALDDAFIAD